MKASKLIFTMVGIVLVTLATGFAPVTPNNNSAGKRTSGGIAPPLIVMKTTSNASSSRTRLSVKKDNDLEPRDPKSNNKSLPTMKELAISVYIAFVVSKIATNQDVAIDIAILEAIFVGEMISLSIGSDDESGSGPNMNTNVEDDSKDE